MSDPASLLAAAAALVLAAAFALREVAKRQGPKPEAAVEQDLLIHQTAEQVGEAVGKLRDVLDAVKAVRADVRHDMRNELIPVVDALGEIERSLQQLLQRRR